MNKSFNSFPSKKIKATTPSSSWTFVFIVESKEDIYFFCSVQPFLWKKWISCIRNTKKWNFRLLIKNEYKYQETNYVKFN